MKELKENIRLMFVFDYDCCLRLSTIFIVFWTVLFGESSRAKNNILSQTNNKPHLEKVSLSLNATEINFLE